MNDPSPQVELQVLSRKLFPSQPNSVFVYVATKSQEIFVNPTTGDRIRGSPIKVSPSFLIDFNLHSSSHHHIRSLLHDQFVVSHDCLCDDLASKISTAAINSSIGYNGFTLTMTVTVTYQTPVFVRNDFKSMTMVLLGTMRAEELKSLKMETESCSICLENLSGSKPSDLTRVTCSHVFHSQCLLEWLNRKNTCPLCRTVLFDR